MRGTKPRGLATGRHCRNAIIAGLLGAAAICTGCYFLLDRHASTEQKPTNLVVQEPTQQQIELTEEADAPSDSGYNSPEYAKAALRSYYSALAEGNVGKLREIGANAAADALERQWLASINYKIDLSKMSSPNREGFPPARGIYAGCSIYKISDFWTTPPTESVQSDITGTTGCEGWIYYDPTKSEWTVADPTIPTAINGAEAPNVQRVSTDNFVTVKMSSPGAFSNPWWSFTQLAIDISNLSTRNDVGITPAIFDEGFTVNVPDELLRGVPHANERSRDVESNTQSQQTSNTNTNQNQNQNTDANSNTNSSAGDSNTNVVRGVASVWRGDLKDFGIEKIGAGALSINGDICPIEAIYDNERVSPVFAIGTTASTELQSLMTKEQIERYKATGDAVPSVDEKLATRQQQQSGGSTSSALRGSENE